VQGWEVEHRRESARSFHARPIPTQPARAVWICDTTAPALVLGSAQRDDVVDHDACARAGIEVVRRHSGGGAVLVVPGDLLWLDVLVPAHDPLWSVDVGHAFQWLGDVWHDALAELGVSTVVHEGALLRPAWSDLVCFAGTGPGEVLDTAAAKVVGLSQRRTREAARFQCAALSRWDPGALLDLLALEPQTRGEAARDLREVASGVDVPLDALLEAFLHHLP